MPMKRLLAYIVFVLFAVACVERGQEPTVEQRIDEFNRRAMELSEVITVRERVNVWAWYLSLDEDKQADVKEACEKYIALRDEVSQWRKTLSSEELERVKIHMRHSRSAVNMQRIEDLNRLSTQIMMRETVTY